MTQPTKLALDLEMESILEGDVQFIQDAVKAGISIHHSSLTQAVCTAGLAPLTAYQAIKAKQSIGIRNPAAMEE